MWICIHYVTVPIIFWKIMALADLIKVMDSVKVFGPYAYRVCCAEMWVFIHTNILKLVPKSVFRVSFACNTNSSLFDQGCSYMAQWLPIGCRWQKASQITHMTRESKVKDTYFRPLTWTPLLFFDQGCSYLAKRLPIGCRWQKASQITHMTWESKVKVPYTKICLSGW